MTIFVDIDETICTKTYGDYSEAQPIKKNIGKINKLFDEGHAITYYTSRGATTGKNWESLTYAQLKKWKVKYHKVLFNKPFYDIFIDDKAYRIEEIEL